METFVSVSGGKDSAATYLLAIERGKPFRAIFADTGNEHPLTYEFVEELETHGGVIIERVSADFTDRLKKKRKTVETKWRDEGVDEDIIQNALQVLKPSGSHFLDLALWKGRFPSTMARFCTQYLKTEPIHNQIVAPALLEGDVFVWTGERRDESLRRANLPKIQRVKYPNSTYVRVRPLINYTAENVFDLHKKHGLEPNPLYKMGFSRVGCMPCIMARKSELREISIRFPDVIDRLENWEIFAGRAAKRGVSSFFASKTTPRGRREKAIVMAREVFDWSRTKRGGRERDYLNEGVVCRSEYGLCE